MARALAKNPEDRFRSAREFAAAAAAASTSLTETLHALDAAWCRGTDSHPTTP
jgi:hypothetical protein